MTGSGRPVGEVERSEPGYTYFTALRKWPEAAGISRTELARLIGCGASNLSALLANRGPEAAGPTALEWAVKIIKACGTDQDLANWSRFHSDVISYKTGVIGELPPPPEPGKEYGARTGRPATAADSRLRRLSERLATELDLASSQDLDSEQHKLSAGLYVRRTQQDVILDMLRPANYDKPVLVHGVAGEGKSSLLWGLYQELKEDTALEVYLLNSPWLTDMSAGLVEELRTITDDARTAECVVVFLIDTVDLLLHDELHRQQVLDLCELMTDAGAEIVLTSRPEEALTLPRPSFRTVGLQPYDDIELPQAVAKHVAAFCSNALPGALDEACRLIIESAARGLTVREIVLNPLKLRLLFELYQPDFPSLEHDVSSLYEMYWTRRVRTDQRGEVAITADADLSMPAEHCAIGLLAAGRIELGQRLFARSAASVAASWHRDGRNYEDALADTEAAVLTLIRRGVLIRSVEAIRFFHQTLFEYAAAIGLLARDGARALTFLIDHLTVHPDDLFVGAITEQALILALQDPLVAPAAGSVLDSLVASGIPSLQRIALGVLAHQPTAQETTERLIDTVDTAALRRYAQTVPAVAKVDVGLQVSRLTRVWGRHESVRESVLEALARLGARNPAVVVAALRDLDCVRIALTWKDDPARMVKLVARVLVATATADPIWARTQLLTLFDDAIDRNTHRNVPLYLVELIAGAWPALGSPETATELQDRIVRCQQRRDAAASDMRQALGRIQALAWRDQLSALEEFDGGHGARDTWWMEVVEDLCARLEHDYYDVLANARLHAIAELTIDGRLDAALAIRTVERLATLRGSAPFALGTLFSRLLAAGETPRMAPVTGAIIAMLEGLPAPGNRPPEGPPRWAHVVRKAVCDAELPAIKMAALLANLSVAQHAPHWLADDYLAVLLVPAAVGGHKQARAALELVTGDAGLLSAAGQKNVSYDIVRHLDKHACLLTLLVDLSARRNAATPLSDVIPALDGELLAGIREQSARLTELIESLFNGKGVGQKEAASLWRRLYNVSAVPAPDHPTLVRRFQATSALAARGNILELATDVALNGELDPPIVDRMLRDLFTVDQQSQAIVSPGTSQAGHIAITARAAWLRLTCRCRQPTDLDFDELLHVATATPVTVDLLAVVGHLISTLAQQGKPATATELLLRIAEAVNTTELSGKQENSLANKLRPAMRSIFRFATADDQRALLAKVPALPAKHARVLVAAAAQENFTTLRSNLSALLQGDLPVGVAQQIHDDVRVRSRSAASGALPNLLLPLASDGRPRPDPGHL